MASPILIAFARPAVLVEKLEIRTFGKIRGQRILLDKSMHSVRRLKLSSYYFCWLRYLLHLCPWVRLLFTKQQSIHFYIIRIVGPSTFPINYSWNFKIWFLVMKSLELEKLMWLLSTLGGAFSALGEYDDRFADRANQVSMKQLDIAFSLGDELLVARCKLFIALSFIQRHRLRQARIIIRSQFIEARRMKSTLLENCCKGVWSRLRLAYKRRGSTRRNRSTNGLISRR